MGKQTTLKSFNFDPISHIQIKDMSEKELKDYCRAKIEKYEKDRR